MSVAPNATTPTTTPTKAPVPSGKIQFFSIGRMLLIIVAVAALVGVFAYLKDRPLEARTAKSAESPTVPGGKAEQQPPPPVKLSPGEIASKYADAVVVL